MPESFTVSHGSDEDPGVWTRIKATVEQGLPSRSSLLEGAE